MGTGTQGASREGSTGDTARSRAAPGSVACASPWGRHLPPRTGPACELLHIPFLPPPPPLAAEPGRALQAEHTASPLPDWGLTGQEPAPAPPPPDPRGPTPRRERAPAQRPCGENADPGHSPRLRDRPLPVRPPWPRASGHTPALSTGPGRHLPPKGGSGGRGRRSPSSKRTSLRWTPGTPSARPFPELQTNFLSEASARRALGGG